MRFWILSNSSRCFSTPKACNQFHQFLPSSVRVQNGVSADTKYEANQTKKNKIATVTVLSNAEASSTSRRNQSCTGQFQTNKIKAFTVRNISVGRNAATKNDREKKSRNDVRAVISDANIIRECVLGRRRRHRRWSSPAPSAGGVVVLYRAIAAVARR